LAERSIESTSADTVMSGIKLWDQVEGRTVWLEVVGAVRLDVGERSTWSFPSPLRKENERDYRTQSGLQYWVQNGHTD